MKVLFMGTPAFAAVSLKSLLDAGHSVPAVVTRPDAAAGRGLTLRPSAVKTLAADQGITVLQPDRIKDPVFLDQIDAIAPEIVVVVAFGRLLPPRLLTTAPLGAVNLHASLLPKYRGAAPIPRAIARGETQTGVTTMRMIERLDAGDILLQRVTPIAPEENAGDLEARLAVMGAGLLLTTLKGLEAGSITPTPQDEAGATFAPTLKKEDGLIDWTRPAEEIARRVRAFDPRPGAYTRLAAPDARTLRVWMARVDPAGAGGAEAGTVLSCVRGGDPSCRGLRVACGADTCLLLVTLQPEGRRRMTAAEVVSGRHLKEGDSLGGE